MSVLGMGYISNIIITIETLLLVYILYILYTYKSVICIAIGT